MTIAKLIEDHQNGLGHECGNGRVIATILTNGHGMSLGLNEYTARKQAEKIIKEQGIKPYGII